MRKENTTLSLATRNRNVTLVAMLLITSMLAGIPSASATPHQLYTVTDASQYPTGATVNTSTVSYMLDSNELYSLNVYIYDSNQSIIWSSSTNITNTSYHAHNVSVPGLADDTYMLFAMLTNTSGNTTSDYVNFQIGSTQSQNQPDCVAWTGSQNYPSSAVVDIEVAVWDIDINSSYLLYIEIWSNSNSSMEWNTTIGIQSSTFYSGTDNVSGLTDGNYDLDCRLWDTSSGPLSTNTTQFSIGTSSSGGGDHLEPNEDLANGTVISPNWFSNNLSIHHSGDCDIFIVNISAGHNVWINLTFNHSSADIDFEVYDQNQSAIGGAYSSSDDESISFTTNYSGWYLIGVYAYGGTASYTFSIETSSVPPPPSDMDGDGIPDQYDSDRDGDGWSNGIEVAAGSNPNDVNSTPSDCDQDGVPDIYDGGDSDSDGISDAQEVNASTDPCDDSSYPPAVPDMDGDGIPDANDSDIDGDGWSNSIENAAGSDAYDIASTPSDCDLDGVPDIYDGGDSDGDGTSDAQEVSVGTNPCNSSSHPPAVPDMDSDGIPDANDSDIDGDGWSNSIENAAGSDAYDSASTPSDCDLDGVPDIYDGGDSDGDGISDAQEVNASTDPCNNNSQPPAVPDMDGDGIPDANDSDIDGDGWSNSIENAAGSDAYDSASTPNDCDQDGVPDIYDGGDSDGDGISDAQEVNASTDPCNNNSQPPAVPDMDGDGIPDQYDADRDGDGWSNGVEDLVGSDANNSSSAPSDVDNDGMPDIFDMGDTDGDGFSDAEEHAANTDPNDASDVPSSGGSSGGGGLPGFELTMTIISVIAALVILGLRRRL